VSIRQFICLCGCFLAFLFNSSNLTFFSNKQNSPLLDDGYVGVMCATTLSLEKSGCFVLCGIGRKFFLQQLHASDDVRE